jgi:hypothetical protein
LRLNEEDAAQWRRRAGPRFCGDSHCEPVHDPNVVTNRREITLELDMRFTHQSDDLAHFLSPRLGQLLPVMTSGSNVQRQREAHLLRPPLDRIQHVARQSIGGDADGAANDADEQHQAQSHGRPLPGSPSRWAVCIYRARVDGRDQLWRRVDHRQGGQELILRPVGVQGRFATCAAGHMFLQSVLLGRAQFAVDSELLPYLLTAHLSAPLRMPVGTCLGRGTGGS